MITEKQVIKVLEEALRIDSGSMTIDSSSLNVENWDSLGHLSILTSLDKIFDGKIAEISDMAEAESVEKILNLLKLNSLI